MCAAWGLERLYQKEASKLGPQGTPGIREITRRAYEDVSPDGEMLSVAGEPQALGRHLCSIMSAHLPLPLRGPWGWLGVTNGVKLLCGL